MTAAVEYGCVAVRSTVRTPRTGSSNTGAMRKRNARPQVPGLAVTVPMSQSLLREAVVWLTLKITVRTHRRQGVYACRVRGSCMCEPTVVGACVMWSTGPDNVTGSDVAHVQGVCVRVCGLGGLWCLPVKGGV